MGPLTMGRRVQPGGEREAFRAGQLPCLRAGAASEHLSHSVWFADGRVIGGVLGGRWRSWS